MFQFILNLISYNLPDNTIINSSHNTIIKNRTYNLYYEDPYSYLYDIDHNKLNNGYLKIDYFSDEWLFVCH